MSVETVRWRRALLGSLGAHGIVLGGAVWLASGGEPCGGDPACAANELPSEEAEPVAADPDEVPAANVVIEVEAELAPGDPREDEDDDGHDDDGDDDSPSEADDDDDDATGEADDDDASNQADDVLADDALADDALADDALADDALADEDSAAEDDENEPTATMAHHADDAAAVAGDDEDEFASAAQQPQDDAVADAALAEVSRKRTVANRPPPAPWSPDATDAFEAEFLARALAPERGPPASSPEAPAESARSAAAAAPAPLAPTPAAPAAPAPPSTSKPATVPEAMSAKSAAHKHVTSTPTASETPRPATPKSATPRPAPPEPAPAKPAPPTPAAPAATVLPSPSSAAPAAETRAGKSADPTQADPALTPRSAPPPAARTARAPAGRTATRPPTPATPQPPKSTDDAATVSVPLSPAATADADRLRASEEAAIARGVSARQQTIPAGARDPRATKEGDPGENARLERKSSSPGGARAAGTGATRTYRFVRTEGAVTATEEETAAVPASGYIGDRDLTVATETRAPTSTRRALGNGKAQDDALSVPDDVRTTDDATLASFTPRAPGPAPRAGGDTEEGKGPGQPRREVTAGVTTTRPTAVAELPAANAATGATTPRVAAPAPELPKPGRSGLRLWLAPRPEDIHEEEVPPAEPELVLRNPRAPRKPRPAPEKPDPAGPAPTAAPPAEPAPLTAAQVLTEPLVPKDSPLPRAAADTPAPPPADDGFWGGPGLGLIDDGHDQHDSPAPTPGDAVPQFQFRRDGAAWTDFAVVDAAVARGERTQVNVQQTELGTWFVPLDNLIRAAWVFPAEEQALGTRGRVVVEFSVDTDGRLGDVAMLDANVPLSMQEAALAALPAAVAPPPDGFGGLRVRYVFRYGESPG